jgi:hypothetical protein
VLNEHALAFDADDGRVFNNADRGWLNDQWTMGNGIYGGFDDMADARAVDEDWYCHVAVDGRGRNRHAVGWRYDDVAGNGARDGWNMDFAEPLAAIVANGALPAHTCWMGHDRFVDPLHNGRLCDVSRV